MDIAQSNVTGQVRMKVEAAQERNLISSPDTNGVLKTEGPVDATGVASHKVKPPVDDFQASVGKTRRAMEEALQKVADQQKALVKMHVNRNTGQLVARIVGREDGRLIREMPPEKLMEHFAYLAEKKGGLLDHKV